MSNYEQLLNQRNHISAKLEFWMKAGRMDRVREYLRELAACESAIDAELEGDLILN